MFRPEPDRRKSQVAFAGTAGGAAGKASRKTVRSQVRPGGGSANRRPQKKRIVYVKRTPRPISGARFLMNEEWLR